jgi:hypothetical protein
LLDIPLVVCRLEPKRESNHSLPVVTRKINKFLVLIFTIDVGLWNDLLLNTLSFIEVVADVTPKLFGLPRAKRYGQVILKPKDTKTGRVPL